MLGDSSVLTVIFNNYYGLSYSYGLFFSLVGSLIDHIFLEVTTVSKHINGLVIGTHLLLFDSSVELIKTLIKDVKSVISIISDSIYYRKISLEAIVVQFRQYLQANLFQILPEPYSTLVFTLLFGSSGTMPPYLRQLLKVTGTSHILSVSGFHLTLFLKLNQLWISLLKIKILMICLLFFLAIGYSLLVGLRPPIVRALWMTVHHTLCSQWWYIQYRPFHSLVLFVIVAYIWDSQIFQSISFQFSVAATFGIVMLVPILSKPSWLWQLEIGAVSEVMLTEEEKRWSIFKHLRRFFGEVILVSIAAQLATIPLVLYHFGEISSISIIVTTLTAWLVPMLFASGILISLLLLPLVSLLEAYFSLFTEVVNLLMSSWLYFLSLFLYQILEWFAKWEYIVLIQVNDYPLWAVFGWWGFIGMYILKKTYE